MASAATPHTQIPTRGIPAGAARSSAVITVAAVAVQVMAGVAPLEDRTRIIVVAIDQPIMVYPTAAVSPTLGIYVGTGASVELDGALGQSWYAIRYGASSAAVAVYEVAE